MLDESQQTFVQIRDEIDTLLGCDDAYSLSPVSGATRSLTRSMSSVAYNKSYTASHSLRHSRSKPKVLPTKKADPFQKLLEPDSPQILDNPMLINELDKS